MQHQAKQASLYAFALSSFSPPLQLPGKVPNGLKIPCRSSRHRRVYLNPSNNTLINSQYSGEYPACSQSTFLVAFQPKVPSGRVTRSTITFLVFKSACVLNRSRILFGSAHLRCAGPGLKPLPPHKVQLDHRDGYGNPCKLCPACCGWHVRCGRSFEVDLSEPHTQRRLCLALYQDILKVASQKCGTGGDMHHGSNLTQFVPTGV